MAMFLQATARQDSILVCPIFALQYRQKGSGHHLHDLISMMLPALMSFLCLEISESQSNALGKKLIGYSPLSCAPNCYMVFSFYFRNCDIF